MLKKTITFKDLDGHEIVEDFYFNLSKAELAELALPKGGMDDYLLKIIADKDGRAVIAAFKEIIQLSFGVRSEDGRRFIKSPELWEYFSQTDAYSVLFLELVTQTDAGVEFVNGVMPSDLIEKRDAKMDAPVIAGLEMTLAPEPIDGRPAWVRENREPTKHEIAGMTKDELIEAFRAHTDR